jgi:hypothetical protein
MILNLEWGFSRSIEVRLLVLIVAAGKHCSTALAHFKVTDATAPLVA